MARGGSGNWSTKAPSSGKAKNQLGRGTNSRVERVAPRRQIAARISRIAVAAARNRTGQWAEARNLVAAFWRSKRQGGRRSAPPRAAAHATSAQMRYFLAFSYNMHDSSVSIADEKRVLL